MAHTEYCFNCASFFSRIVRHKIFRFKFGIPLFQCLQCFRDTSFRFIFRNKMLQQFGNQYLSSALKRITAEHNVLFDMQHPRVPTRSHSVVIIFFAKTPDTQIEGYFVKILIFVLRLFHIPSFHLCYRLYYYCILRGLIFVG